MARLRQRLRAWWNKDALETAEEETRMTQAERDVAEEDYEARKDDPSPNAWESPTTSDSEPPSDSAP